MICEPLDSRYLGHKQSDINHLDEMILENGEAFGFTNFLKNFTQRNIFIRKPNTNMKLKMSGTISKNAQALKSILLVANKVIKPKTAEKPMKENTIENKILIPSLFLV
jgi:hypothetical protein